MCFFTSGVFWGSLLVLWGVSMILNALFHINIPFFRIAFALIVIWFGVRLLIGGRCWKSDHSAVFSGADFKADKARKDYNAVFGNIAVDLSGIKLEGGETRTEINAVFGSAQVRVGQKYPVVVKANSVFGSVRLPDGKAVSFGDGKWANRAPKSGEKVLEVEVNAVFGQVEVTGSAE